MAAVNDPALLDEIREISDKLAWAREQAKKAEEEAGKFKGIRDGYQDKLLALFEGAGIKSIKDKKGRTISAVQKPKFTVTDEQALRADLMKRDPAMAERVFVEKIDKRALTAYAAPILKSDGEVFAGVEAEMSEYVSVRNPAKATT